MLGLVNRVAQKEQIIAALDIVEGQVNDLVIEEWYGIGGLGKSWVLDEAKKQCRQKDYHFVVIDFLACSAMNPDTQKIEFLLRICDQLDRFIPNVSGIRTMLEPFVRLHKGNDSPSTNVEFAQLLPNLCDEFAKLLAEKYFILMLDSTERCTEEMFRWIGQEFLQQLRSQSEKFPLIVFLAGRGPLLPSWPRRLIKSPTSHRLDPLTFEHMQEQWQRLLPDEAYSQISDEVYKISNGHPYSTKVLADFLQENGISPDEFEQAREHIAMELFNRVVKSSILADKADWVAPFLEIACVPRRFEAAMLAELIPKYKPDVPTSPDVTQWYIARLSDLQGAPSFLVEVGDESPAYELEPTLRKLLHTTRAIIDPEETVRIHQDTITIWRKSINGEGVVSRTAVTAIKEVLYHTIQIAVIEKKPDAADIAGNTLQELLANHFTRPLSSRNLPELNWLKDKLSQDTDLFELLGNDRRRLIEQIDQFLAPLPTSETKFEFSHLIVEHFPPSEYRVSWYKDNQVAVSAESVYSERNYTMQQWREHPDRVGRVARASYLPRRAQEFVQRNAQLAIQLGTDWTDIPWELLHDGQEFLCLRHPMARKPRTLKEPQPIAEKKEKTLRAFVIGNPSDDLPGAEAEAQAVAELLSEQRVEVDLLVGSDQAKANEFALKLVTETYDLIHFAGHGYFDPAKPNLSGLRFANDELYYAEEFERSILNGNPFVFLSACSVGKTNSATSEQGFRGKFVEGVAISALMGGAIGCLAPMWEIGDNVAIAFALKFYEKLLSEETIGESVRQARLSVKDKTPDFWASWVLYGHPMQLLLNES